MRDGVVMVVRVTSIKVDHNSRQKIAVMVNMRRKWMGECFFFFKQKTAYEIRNCDWSSDVCSSA